MTQVKIKWEAGDRILPRIGEVRPGDIITVPDHVATSYIYQGLAVALKLKKEKADEL